MSNVSGSAAGSPSGTTVPVTLAQQEHVFPEPTDPAPKKYVTWLIIAQFVFFVALLGPAVVGIGLKIQALQASGAIENSAYGFNTASAMNRCRSVISAIRPDASSVEQPATARWQVR